MSISEKILVEESGRFISVNEKQYYRDSEKKFEKTVKRVLPHLYLLVCLNINP